LLMPLTLTGTHGLAGALLGDLAIGVAATAAIVAGRLLFRTALADEAKRESKERHWALQLRVAILLLLALGAAAERTGASLLGAGSAPAVGARSSPEPHRLVHQLTGLATGFFVPAFFVLLGATLDVAGLVRSPAAIALAIAMGAAATAVHVLAALVAGR